MRFSITTGTGAVSKPMKKQGATQGNSLRVIGGQWRSRRLSFPDLQGLRPTPGRVRETLFNWLQEKVPGARCLDLFAGSGACGIEALSRGAAHVTFVDQARSATAAIQDNLQSLGTDSAEVVCEDALAWLGRQSRPPKPFSLVFLDPPFGSNDLAAACRLLESQGLLEPGALIYIESGGVSEDLPAGWQRLKLKKAGAVHYSLFKRGPV